MGRSEPVTAADRLWRSAAAQVAPARALARTDAHARLVLLVASALPVFLSAIGLLAAQRLEADDVARLLMLAAIGFAVAAAGLGWSCQLLRMAAKSHPVNLIDVQGWYQRQFRRAYWVWVAGTLALIGIALAAASATVVLS